MFGVAFYGEKNSKLDIANYPLMIVGKQEVGFNSARYPEAVIPNVSYPFDFAAIRPHFSSGWVGGTLLGGVDARFPGGANSRYSPTIKGIGIPSNARATVYYLRFQATPKNSNSDFGIALYGEDKSLLFTTESPLANISYAEEQSNPEYRPLLDDEAILITQPTEWSWLADGSPEFGTSGGMDMIELSSGVRSGWLYYWVSYWPDGEYARDPTTRMTTLLYIKIPSSYL